MPTRLYFVFLRLNFYSLLGDVAFRILETINSDRRRATQNMLGDYLLEKTEIYVCDINPNMLNVGKTRAQERGGYCISG